MTPRHRAPERAERTTPGRPGRRRRGSSNLSLIWVYPDLLSTYGDRGNLLVLQRRAVPRLTGCENHQGVTTLGPGARPLAQVTVGVGNGDGTEGAYAGRVVGTYLHGPVLVRNPGLADLLLSWGAGPLAALPGADEEWARRLRDERLTAVAG